LTNNGFPWDGAPVADLFGAYELLAKSGLFDAEYYIRANPDIAALNIDPLMHYLEKGALEMRNPSGAFDAHHYAQLCQERGERVHNPLLHYIEFGASQGLAPTPPKAIVARYLAHESTETEPASPEAAVLLLGLDRIGVDRTQGAMRLIGAGWCLAASPIIELTVALGSISVRARYGLQRPDVARTYRKNLKADHSGFEFTLQPVSEDPGPTNLIFTAKTDLGVTTQSSIRFDLTAVGAAEDSTKPAAPIDTDPPTFGKPPMQLYVDSAEVDESGILHLVGWVVCLASIVSVDVFVDDETLAAAEYGKPRDDVAASHSEYPNARYSGFALHTDVSSYGGGERLIKIQAKASTGISRETMLPLMFSGGRRASVPFGDRSKVHLFCELIEVTTSGRIAIKGWVVSAVATDRLSVLLDGNEIADAEIGIERPDVGNHFPALAHARRAGFTFRHVLSPIDGGEHLVILRHRAGGEETDILLPVLALASASTIPEADLSTHGGSENLLLSIDVPKVVDGTVVDRIRGALEITGWAMARRGVASIDIIIDGERITSANTGIRRIDVQRTFPNWDDAIASGFSVLLPHRTLPRGQHKFSIVLHDRAGQVAQCEFKIEVEEPPDTEGPWSLRRRMTPAEIDVRTRPLLGSRQQPSFGIIIPAPCGAMALEQARATLASLGMQAYENWRLHILAPKSTRQLMPRRHALLDRLDELSDRVEVLSDDRAVGKLFANTSPASHLMILRAGDELGCDALLEFAAYAMLHPQADFLYSDERRLSPASGKVEAFFKPNWSPDLQLSMNYVGRSWCAPADIFRRASIRPRELVDPNSYHLALRLTEHARSIHHVPGTLLQATRSCAEDEASERRALKLALRRRGISAAVKTGLVAGTFRVQRKTAARGLVSIIIPTCAARGLIRTCIETLRGVTSYQNIEIVCIENISSDKQDWAAWLRGHADRVIHTAEPFNWSRYNNQAMTASRGEFLAFLNDDIEIIDPAWLDVLLEQAQRLEVGVIGPQLLYPDRRVQHAGMFLAGVGVARHAFRYAAEDDPGYFGLALTQRDVIAVTGACLMTRRETFETLGRFDETHDVVNNDIDYCLRNWRRGLRTIYTPHTRLIHHEFASRADIADNYNAAAFESKWRSVFAAGDPFYHPRLTKERDDFSTEWEPVEVLCAGNPVLARESIRRILVVKLDHIGDCVLALPAVRRLKRIFPGATLSVLTGRASKAIWALEPAVDELIEFDFFHARSSSGLVDRTEKDWCELRKRLAPYRFDLAIDLRKNWETRPVLQCTGARYLAGFDVKGRFPWLDVAVEWAEDVALLRKRQHTADDLVNLVDAVAAASEPDRSVIATLQAPITDQALPWVPRARHIFRKRVVCVHPSAGNVMKQWPPEYFAALINQLIETEHVHVILVGGPDELGIGSRIIELVDSSRSIWSLIGRVALDDLPALIARCSLFVGNDSGPKHVAAGLGIPTVGIHSGVVDSREWGPKGTNAVAIQRAMNCAPCYHSKLEDCRRGLACLNGIWPGDVAHVCRRLLAPSSPAPYVGRKPRRPTEHAAMLHEEAKVAFLSAEPRQ